MKMRLTTADVLILTLLLLFYAFLFLGQALIALVVFTVAITVSLVFLLRAKSTRKNGLKKEELPAKS
jgi:Flp pilus assembly protein TadB